MIHVGDFFIIVESPDLNPIEMVWNQLKRHLAWKQPRSKEELQECIHFFWDNVMTIELCNRYIDHVFKVAPVEFKMNGKASGDLPNRLFNERSEGKDMQYFSHLMSREEMDLKLRRLIEKQAN